MLDKSLQGGRFSTLDLFLLLVVKLKERGGGSSGSSGGSHHKGGDYNRLWGKKRKPDSGALLFSKLHIHHIPSLYPPQV